MNKKKLEEYAKYLAKTWGNEYLSHEYDKSRGVLVVKCKDYFVIEDYYKE